jgi:hypothetical protein
MFELFIRTSKCEARLSPTVLCRALLMATTGETFPSIYHLIPVQLLQQHQVIPSPCRVHVHFHVLR